jgi:hypothetical protein
VKTLNNQFRDLLASGFKAAGGALLLYTVFITIYFASIGTFSAWPLSLSAGILGAALLSGAIVIRHRSRKL